MQFRVEFTQPAADHVRSYRKFDQKIILEGIQQHLTHQPNVETRNRKRLTSNEQFDWELRLEKFRVFYDVVLGDDQVVKIKAVGHKEHNKLHIGGHEVQL
jgi:mRNA-degrading endonuclease RelE of RelBE toxin-antitoxin system